MPTKAQLEQELEKLKAELKEKNPPAESSDLDEADDEQDEKADKEEIDIFLEEATIPDSNLVVDGYRYDDEGDGKIRYVHRWTLGEFSLQKVKEIFGGGRWNFRLRKPPPSNKHIKSRTILIEGPQKNPEAIPDDRDPRTFGEKVMDTQAQIVEKLHELRNPPRETANVDPINMALSIVGAFDQILGPMREELREARRDKKGPDFDQLVTIFKQGMELGKLSTPPAADPMGQVMASMLPPLVSAIGGQKQPGPMDVLTNPPESPMPQETQTMHQDRPPNRPPWDYLLSQWMPHLVRWARKDSDPELRAAFVVDEIPAEAEAVLLEQLRRGPEFVSEIVMLHPEIRPWKEWLRRFVVAMADNYVWGTEEAGPYPFAKEADHGMSDETLAETSERPTDSEREDSVSGPELGTK